MSLSSWLFSVNGILTMHFSLISSSLISDHIEVFRFKLVEKFLLQASCADLSPSTEPGELIPKQTNHKLTVDSGWSLSRTASWRSAPDQTNTSLYLRHQEAYHPKEHILTAATLGTAALGMFPYVPCQFHNPRSPVGGLWWTDTQGENTVHLGDCSYDVYTENKEFQITCEGWAVLGTPLLIHADLRWKSQARSVTASHKSPKSP